MKTAVTMYSYDQILSSGEKTMVQCLEIAKKTGFDGVEFIDLKPENDMDKREYALYLRDLCANLGLEIVCYSISAQLYRPTAEETKSEIDRVKGEVEIASLLGAKKMRHDVSTGAYDSAGRLIPFERALPSMAKSCREITEYAANLGIMTMTENHGMYCQDSDRMEKLYASVNHKNFRLLIDIGNFVCADEDPVKAVGRLSQYAGHVHAKDFYIRPATKSYLMDGFFTSRGGAYLRGAILGHGDLPVQQCLKTLINSGYDDYIVLEFEGLEDCIKGTTIGFNVLRHLLTT